MKKQKRARLAVRLFGVDCPDGGQPFGAEGTVFNRKKVEGQPVRVTDHSKDAFGRTIGEVFTADGQSLDELFVRNGLAWWYHGYAPGQGILGALQMEGRATRRGLWVRQNPVLPWAWRHPQNSQE